MSALFLRYSSTTRLLSLREPTAVMALHNPFSTPANSQPGDGAASQIIANGYGFLWARRFHLIQACSCARGARCVVPGPSNHRPARPYKVECAAGTQRPNVTRGDCELLRRVLTVLRLFSRDNTPPGDREGFAVTDSGEVGALSSQTAGRGPSNHRRSWVVATGREATTNIDPPEARLTVLGNVSASGAQTRTLK